MFGKEDKCRRCKSKVKKDWEYCPFCGFPLRDELEREPFSLVRYFEKEIEEEFKRLDRIFKEDFFEFPRFKIPIKGGGVSITITQTGEGEPKISVKTYGSYKGLEDKLKVKVPIVEEDKEKYEEKIGKVEVTEEAEFQIKNEDGKKVIEVNLPDVKKMDDIHVKKLSQSIEVRAFVGNKAYFNLIPISGNEKIVSQEFKNGKLRIYLE